MLTGEALLLHLLDCLAVSQSLATMALLVIMGNMIFTLQKLHYKTEYVGAAIVLAVLLVLRVIFASKSKATQPAQAAKRNVEKKVD